MGRVGATKTFSSTCEADVSRFNSDVSLGLKQERIDPIKKSCFIQCSQCVLVCITDILYMYARTLIIFNSLIHSLIHYFSGPVPTPHLEEIPPHIHVHVHGYGYYVLLCLTNRIETNGFVFMSDLMFQTLLMVMRVQSVFWHILAHTVVFGFSNMLSCR